MTLSTKAAAADRVPLQPPSAVPSEHAVSLPTGAELLAAIRSDSRGTHPLSTLANKLGTLHRFSLKLANSTAIDAERLSLITAIDGWATAHITHLEPPITHRHESLGDLIDTLASTQIHAYHLLMNGDPADPAVHAAWHRLAEQVEEYSTVTSTALTSPTREKLWRRTT